ncbi:hypothetical protein DEO72_LG4g1173 [Vigna unguiculata]|uniref:Uncharacterized protein n=1 Tax=Vigna unguiculata TaxID=3917 RepID=A0A4D6LP75_VIGUN|nr:hypothetical protein DEO72_LG4g1173 [Vigna unguiculata]
MDERLRVGQRCRNMEQEWYKNKQILSDMLRDASKNNFIELLVTVNTTPQPHQRFPENPDFNALRHEIKDVLLKLAIKAEQMSEELSLLMNDTVRKVTLEDMMNMMTEMMKMNQTDQKENEDLSMLMNDTVRKVTLEDMMNMMTEMMKMNQIDQKEMMNATTQSLQNQSEKLIAESHHTDISTDRYNDAHSNMSTDGHINFAKDVADEEIKDSHKNISTDGYVDDAPCEYKVVLVDDVMSTNDQFQEQSCENNTIEEPSAVEEPKYLKMQLKHLLLQLTWLMMKQ